MPLLLDGQSLATLAVYEIDGTRCVSSSDVITLIQEKLAPEVRAQVLQALQAKPMWPLDETRGGLWLRYDPASVAVELNLPPHLRKPVNMDLQGETSGIPAGKVTGPADISGYANLYTAQTYQTNMGLMNGRQPLRLDADAAMNVHGWVAEGQATYTEQVRGIGGIKMQNRRLVHDVPNKMLRYQAGELSYPITGLQRYREMIGAGVAKRFDLQPYRVTRPNGRADFVLETPSTVDIYVNGNRLQTLQLAAGTYALSDFPVVNGANDLQLVITDAAGRRVTQTFPVISDGDMLEAGLTSFAASAGLPKNSQAGSGAMFSGLARYGLNDLMTVGTNLQGDAYQQVFGGETSLAGSWGMLHADVALSHDNGLGSDVWDTALRLDYRNIIGQTGRDSWQASAEYRGPMFNLPEAQTPNPYAMTLSASYTRNLTDRTVLTLGGQYRLGRASQVGDDLRLTSNLLWRVDNAWSVNIDTLLGNDDGFGARLGLTWTPAAGTTLMSSYDPKRGTLRADWLQRPADSQLGLDTDMALERRMEAEKAEYALAGTATYTGERGLVRVRQETNTTGLNSLSQQAQARTVQMSMASALVYADGAWGMSRPVANSFVIVDSAGAVGINPQTEAVPDEEEFEGEVFHGNVLPKFEASSGGLGPAVLPDLSPYLYRPVNIDVLPDMGASAGALAALGAPPTGQEQALLLPSYKSGTRLTMTLTPRTTVHGKLVDAAREPLALQAGEIRQVGGRFTAEISEIEPAAGDSGTNGLPIFTNRDGYFSIYGVREGHYELTMAGVEGYAVPFDIAENTHGTLDLGTQQIDILFNRARSELRR